jgi:hypothetical protein
MIMTEILGGNWFFSSASNTKCQFYCTICNVVIGLNFRNIVVGHI